MRTLTIAAVQTVPVFGDPAATLERAAEKIGAISRLTPQVQLVLLPELFLAALPPLLTGPGNGGRADAVPVPGPFTERLGELARWSGVWLVPGSVYERDAEGRVYNTALAFAPDGRLVARYRKIFPWQPYETTTPGREFVTFDIDGVGRVGLAICYDGSFPEVVRQLAWLGAEVIIQPTLTTTRDRELELVFARANAGANQVYVVNLNAADPAAVGQSIIVDPEGIVRQQAGPGEEVLVDVLDLDAVERVRAAGSFGLNRPWSQLGRHDPPLDLPMYGGSLRPAPWAG